MAQMTTAVNRRRGRKTQPTRQKALASKPLASATLDALVVQVDYWPDIN